MPKMDNFLHENYRGDPVLHVFDMSKVAFFGPSSALTSLTAFIIFQNFMTFANGETRLLWNDPTFHNVTCMI